MGGGICPKMEFTPPTIKHGRVIVILEILNIK